MYHLERYHKLGRFEDTRISLRALRAVHVEKHPEKARPSWYLERSDPQTYRMAGTLYFVERRP
jgi:hypothetical protein